MVMNITNCKEELIKVTTALIREKYGEVDKVTIRDISSRSGVSIGLINYHFGNKNNLITECVQRIITKVVTSFKPNMEVGKGLEPFAAGKTRLTKAAQEVFDFFFLHPSITRVSILGDYQNYSNKSNSYVSLSGFSAIIGNAIEDKAEKERISFTLTSAMQVAFLRSFADPHFMGYDLSSQEGRNTYIKDTVDILMR